MISGDVWCCTAHSLTFLVPFLWHGNCGDRWGSHLKPLDNGRPLSASFSIVKLQWVGFCIYSFFVFLCLLSILHLRILLWWILHVFWHALLWLNLLQPLHSRTQLFTKVTMWPGVYEGQHLSSVGKESICGVETGILFLVKMMNQLVGTYCLTIVLPAIVIY